MKYHQSALVNITIVVLSLAGGIGFFVLKDLTAFIGNRLNGRRRFRLTVHTKLVLIVTLIVISIGTIGILLSEHWPPTMDSRDKTLVSLFQAVSASTTDGFNTIDIGKMSAASLNIIMLLMFVGASPGSTGGGIKTTTFALLFVLLWSRIRKRENNVLGREISEQCMYNAVVVALCFMLVAFLDSVILSGTEKTPFIQNLFEILSALGNTGLSTGITSGLSEPAKAILILTMFIGRVGILSLAFALFPHPQKVYFRYPKEDVFVG
jgi:trk system potassium uptake protein TrkH